MQLRKEWSATHEGDIESWKDNNIREIKKKTYPADYGHRIPKGLLRFLLGEYNRLKNRTAQK